MFEIHHSDYQSYSSYPLAPSALTSFLFSALLWGPTWLSWQPSTGKGQGHGNSNQHVRPFGSSVTIHTQGHLGQFFSSVCPLASRRGESWRRQLFAAAQSPFICHGLLSCSCLASVPFGSYKREGLFEKQIPELWTILHDVKEAMKPTYDFCCQWKQYNLIDNSM